MKTFYTVSLAMLAGVAFGAAAVSGLNAQNKAPGAYAVIDISEITDLEVFKTLLPKTAASNAPFGGQTAVQTENIAALDGTPPKRFVIVGFDSIDRAKAWYASAAQKEVNAIRAKSTKSRAFIAEAMTN
jgi:uncharacterized protein (DUF1330 family)